jgi:gluconolactonase
MTTRRAVLAASAALIAAGGSMPAQAAAPGYPHIGRIRRLSPELDEIIAPDAVIEQLADGMTWSEGPVWIWEGKYLLFSDVPANKIYRWSEKDGKTVFLDPAGYDGPPTKIFREPGSNGMTLNLAGELLICDHGNRAVAKVDLATKKKTIIVDRFPGQAIQQSQRFDRGPAGRAKGLDLLHRPAVWPGGAGRLAGQGAGVQRRLSAPPERARSWWWTTS